MKFVLQLPQNCQESKKEKYLEKSQVLGTKKHFLNSPWLKKKKERKKRKEISSQ